MRRLVGKELELEQSEFIGYHKDGWASIPKAALHMNFKEQIDRLHIMTLPDAPFLLTPFPRVPSPRRCAGRYVRIRCAQIARPRICIWGLAIDISICYTVVRSGKKW